MNPISISREITQAFWSAGEQIEGVENASANRLDVHAEILIKLGAVDHTRGEYARAHYEPCLSLLEFGSFWLDRLRQRLAVEVGRASELRFRAPLTLLERSCSHAQGLRSLTVNGLAAPTPAVLRGLLENLQACSLHLGFPEFAAHPAQSQETDSAERFCEDLRSKGLFERCFEEIEARPHFSAAGRRLMEETRESLWASTRGDAQSSHMETEPNTRPPGIEPLGLRELARGRDDALLMSTLNAAIKALWHFANTAGWMLLYDDTRQAPRLDSKVAALRVGAVCFSELVLRHWGGTDRFQRRIRSDFSSKPAGSDVVN